MIELQPEDMPLNVNLNHKQLKELGFESLPNAGVRLILHAHAVVTRSSTEDPNADGDVDFASVTLQLTHLECDEAIPENKVERRYRNAAKLYERDVGGSKDKGEFGSFNRRFGA